MHLARPQRSQQPSDLDETARSLEATGDYKILRRLVPRQAMGVPAGYTGKLGIILDLETTGLDATKDEVIELAMVKFCYSGADEITSLAETFQSFNQPSYPIPAEVTQLTGITDGMVQGHRIDPEKISAFVADANVIIAHNAGFDRKFTERYWPIFAETHWACSMSEIDWRKIQLWQHQARLLAGGRRIFSRGASRHR
jgi:DNA polymerase III subunit epsilon